MYLCTVRSRRATLRISARILRCSKPTPDLYKYELVYTKSINIASYWSGNETSTADIDTVHKCLGNTDLSIRLCFRLADCIFIPWQISHLRSAAVLRISSGSSKNAPGMSASVSTVVTEAWLVENYQQPGTELVLARRMNSGSDAIKNNCIPYAVKGKGLLSLLILIQCKAGLSLEVVPVPLSICYNKIFPCASGLCS